MSEQSNKKVTISKEEYDRLKTAEQGLSNMLTYLKHVDDVQKARKQIENGEATEQEDFFEELGI